MNRLIAIAAGLSIAAATLAACSSNSKENAEPDFCSVVVQAKAAQEGLVTLLNSGEMPPADDLQTALGGFRNLLGDLQRVSPDEIADDMIFVVNGFTAFDLGLQQIDYDYERLFTDPVAAEAAQADMAAMDAPETQAAMDAVNEYSIAKCGIAFDTSRG